MNRKNNNIQYIKDKLKNNSDVIYRDIKCSNGTINLIFIDTITDKNFISLNIVAPLTTITENLSDISIIKDKILFSNIVEDVTTIDDGIAHILSGNVLVMFDFSDKIFYCNAENWQKRNVERPLTDPVLKGPSEGFNESIDNNINLIRKRIKNSSLKIEKITIGDISKTMVGLVYIEGTAPMDLVELIRKRITNLKIDFIVDTNYIEEELKNKNTNFDTIGYTEKPDIVVSRMFEGRVAIILDGTPTALTAPFFFLEYFQSPEDYYFNKYTANPIRMLRIVSFFIAIFLPGFYIALFTHHFALIPPPFAFKIAQARSGVPFSTVIEVLLVLMSFELTKESGRRLPPSIGQTLSIVAGLILGTAATNAGLSSEGTVVVMGTFTIASFVNPRLQNLAPTWTLVCIILTGLVGLHGFYIFFFIILAHIASLNSCGYPYLFPFGTYNKFKFRNKDFLSRGKLDWTARTIFKKGDNK